MNRATTFGPLDTESAATVVGWIHSADELALIAGPTLQWPLTVELLLACGHGPTRDLRVLIQDGTPVAFGTSRHNGESARLGWIVVDPARRGEGWGTELMTRLIADTRQRYGPVPLTLGVFAHNQPAVGLYRSLGFDEQPPQPSVFADYRWQKIEMELRAASDQP